MPKIALGKKISSDKKIGESIAKLNNTCVKPHFMCVHFNACLIKNVVFGCGILELREKQDAILRKKHETKIAKNLRLGSNFPRAAFCSRENSAVIGLIKPKTALAMLERKLYVGNLRENDNTCKIITMQEEVLIIEYGRNWKGKERMTNKPSM